MISPDKSEMLRAFLGSLPKEMASRLASAVELDRLVDGKALPHDLILEGLRPVLRTDDMHKRTPTPLRMFCRPFEDLLVNVAVKEKQKGRILRSHVVPVWSWVSLQLIPEESKAYSSELRNLVVMRKYEEALARAEKFWPFAGETLGKALAADPKKANTALGGPAVAADAEDMATMLRIGGFAVAIQNLLPKPTATLSEELLWGLRNIYDAVAANNADAAPFLSVIAMRRLAKPWEALKLALLVARQTQDTLISSTDMGLAGDVLLSDMEDARTAIMQIRHPVFDVDALINHLTAFTNISTAIVKEVEILREGRWGQRLLKDRAAIGNVMDGFMERAPKEISAALPTHKAGYSGGPRVPDLSRMPDPEKTERALRYAQVLARTRILSVPGSFGAKHTGATEEAQQFVRSYSEDMLKELRTAQGDRRAIVERQFQLCLELTAQLFDESELEFLRRRGKAAGAPSIAA